MRNRLIRAFAAVAITAAFAGGLSAAFVAPASAMPANSPQVTPNLCWYWDDYAQAGYWGPCENDFSYGPN